MKELMLSLRSSKIIAIQGIEREFCPVRSQEAMSFRRKRFVITGVNRKERSDCWEATLSSIEVGTRDWRLGTLHKQGERIYQRIIFFSDSLS